MPTEATVEAEKTETPVTGQANPEQGAAAVDAPNTSDAPATTAVDAPAPGAAEAPTSPAPTATTQPATTTAPDTSAIEAELKQLREDKRRLEIEREAAKITESVRQIEEADRQTYSEYEKRLANLRSVGQKQAKALQDARRDGEEEIAQEIQQQLTQLEQVYNALVNDRDVWLKEAQERKQAEGAKRHEGLLAKQLEEAGLSADDLKKADSTWHPGDFYKTNQLSLKLLKQKLDEEHKAELKANDEKWEAKIKELQTKWDTQAPQSRADSSGAGMLGGPPPAIKLGNTKHLLRKAREAGQL